MANFVHRRNTSEGPRYRVWNTVVDCYETPALTREQVIAYLDHPNASGRVERADVNGTSSRRGDTRDMNGPWDVERCEDGAGNGCGSFHHVFVAREVGGRCADCGEGQSHSAHGRPCFVRPEDGSRKADAPRETRLQTLERWRKVIADADGGLAFEAGRLDGRVHVTDLRTAVRLLDEHPGLFWQELNGRLREAHAIIATLVARGGGEITLTPDDLLRAAPDALEVLSEPAGSLARELTRLRLRKGPGDVPA